MQIFITGGSGFIGSAVLAELVRAGHRVTGLARSAESADVLRTAGARPRRGELEDFHGLAAAADDADAVVHTAFMHDFGRIRDASIVDESAIRAMGEVLASSGRPLVIASPLGLLPQHRMVTESDAPDPTSHAASRAGSEIAAGELAKRGVRSTVVRLPPSVHGEGDPQFVAALIGLARTAGVSATSGPGANRWPAVHRLDAARLFRQVVESSAAPAVVHAVDEEGIPTRAIAAAIARRLGVPLRGLNPTESARHFGWLAPFVALDLIASSAQTRQQTGWKPAGPGLLADLQAGHYFDDAHREVA